MMITELHTTKAPKHKSILPWSPEALKKAMQWWRDSKEHFNEELYERLKKVKFNS